MAYNVSEYAKPRRCFQHKLSLLPNPILADLTPDFNKRGLGEHLALAKREPHTRCYAL
jgi:hypothetical protein